VDITADSFVLSLSDLSLTIINANVFISSGDGSNATLLLLFSLGNVTLPLSTAIQFLPSQGMALHWQ
jgi:hypothetical protein